MNRWINPALVALAAAAIPTGALAQAPPLWATIPDIPPPPTPADSGYVTNGGARLYYARSGPHHGTPVILLHGGFAASDSWGFEIPRLTARHEVIVMDNRGHGRSSLPPGSLSYEQMASDVIAIMDALHVRRASIVGLSDGGIIGLILAIRHPDRVAKLFVWGANFNTHADSDSPPGPAMKGMGATYMAKMQAQYRALSPTPDGFAALRTALGQLYATEPNLSPAELGRIRAPTIVADGEHEQFISAEHTRTLARLIPHAELLILPNVSHGGPQQDPAAFHQALSTFLDGAPSATPEGMPLRSPAKAPSGGDF